MNASSSWTVDHVGIAVTDLDAAIATYFAQAGTTVTLRERVDSQDVELAFLNTAGAKIELLAATSPTSPIAKFLNTRGPGLHHICYKVTSITDELQRLSQMGVRLIDSVPRPGAAHSSIAFLHPSSFCGVLTELVEYSNG